MMKTILCLFVLTAFNAFAECEPVVQTLNEKDFQVHLLNHTPTKSNRHIIIVPPTGGTNVIDRNWGKKFCKAGFNAHILEHWTDDDEYNLDLGIHQRFYARTQRAIKVLLESIPANAFVGIMGTSIGGIHTAMAMGLQDRLNAAFVITAGCDMPSIIAHSDQEVMVTAWNKRKEMFKIPNKDIYENLLRKVILFEPMQLPRKFVGKDLGMIIATSDTTVPTSNQLKLKNLWQPKTVINYSFNHFWAIVLSWIWDSNSVIEFFQNSASAHRFDPNSAQG